MEIDTWVWDRVALVFPALPDIIDVFYPAPFALKASWPERKKVKEQLTIVAPAKSSSKDTKCQKQVLSQA